MKTKIIKISGNGKHRDVYSWTIYTERGTEISGCALSEKEAIEQMNFNNCLTV